MGVSTFERVKYAVEKYSRIVYRKARASLRTRAQVEKKFRRRYFAEIPVDIEAIGEYRAECFPASGPAPWLDRPDALDRIAQKEKCGELTGSDAEACRKWARDGYFIAKKLFDDAYLDEVWSIYEKAVEAGTIKLDAEKAAENDPYPGRFLNPHMNIPALDGMLKHDLLRHWNELLLGRKNIPFQTITAHKGSQQKEHSDSIHMTTYPLGYLIAAWIAFEDIDEGSGPLIYYPGTHVLPYVFSCTLGIPSGRYRQVGLKVYSETYEQAIQKIIADKKLRPAYFMAKKGDVLFWHANLIHGGSTRQNISLSRKSLVCHYFADGAVCYHDLAGMPADPARVLTDPMLKDMLM